MKTWDDVLTESRLTRAAPTLGDERPAPRPSAPAAFASPSDGRSAPRSVLGRHGGPALAAALERADAPREAWPPVADALAELDAAIEAGKPKRIRAAVEAVRARGLLQPTPF